MPLQAHLDLQPDCPYGDRNQSTTRPHTLAISFTSTSRSSDESPTAEGTASSGDSRAPATTLTDRLADALAAVIAEPVDEPPPHVARLHAVALAWVFQTITDEVGRREVAGQDHPEIAAALRPIVEDLFNSIDLWLTTGPHKPT